MVALILGLFRFIRLLGSGHQAVVVESLALRLQLATFQRKRKRPVLTQLDRLFWTGLSQVWSGWRNALVFVQPDRVVRWQRERFRRFWASCRIPSLATEEGPASPPRFDSWFCGWLRPIRSGEHRESTAN
jgi:hypothetical protein